MVKNSSGGNKTKRGARKNITSNIISTKLRLIEEDGENYAIIKKIYGNGMCEAICQDNKSRLCIIRNKFNGKGKSTRIQIGTWVLVGIRDWEVRTDGTQKCDLLEIYDDSDREKLIEKSNVNLLALLNVMQEIGEKVETNSTNDTGFTIVNNSEQAYDEIMTEQNTDKNIILVNNTKIAFDDI